MIAYAYWGLTLLVFAILYALGTRWKMKLWARVVIALSLGAVIGYAFGPVAEQSKWIGDLFVRLIRMLVVPLIFTTIVAGIYAMGDPKRLGSIGIKAILLYMVTTFVAIVIGLGLGTAFQPGAGVELAGVEPEFLNLETPSVMERLFGIVPTNPVEALAQGAVLPIIFFSLLFGVGVVMAGDEGRPIGQVITSAAEAVLKVAHIVMEIAPFGVYALVAWVAGVMGPEALQNLFKLMVLVYTGCFAHMILTYGGLVRFVLGLPIVRFFRGVLDAQAVAFSTSSSAATLPVTLTVVEENLGVKNTVASSVLPIGATINMDGTALYLGIVTMFAVQIFGIDLSAFDYLMIALTVTLASIGTAAVPSAGLFLLATVLTVVGINEAQTALIVGFILPFDRPLDMMRTTVNVTGDAAVATAVGKWEGELDEETFRRVNKA
ncbi:MAG: dicarboxylate/amino acid:cation symporter [Pseudomonadota bacterium]